jgi:hypothetical protein
MEELEALNLLLRAIGSSKVNSTVSTQPDVANAMATLNRYRRSAQKRGWWYNIDYNVSFTVNEDGTVRIPKEYTLVKFSCPDLVVRGTKLYDKNRQSYIFTGNRTIIADRTTYICPWDEMPLSLQEHVAYLANASFIEDEVEDTKRAEVQRHLAGIAMLDVKKEDLEQGQYNTFKKSRVVRARYGVRPYGISNNNIVGFNGDSQYGDNA